MNRILEQIVARTRADLVREPIDLRAAEANALATTERSESHRFRKSLSEKGVRIIAEIKAASPSAGTIVPEPEVASIAREYAVGGAAAISVVTEPHFFRGSRSWLRIAVAASRLPVVMKDFVLGRGQVLQGIAAGADAVLLLASLLSTDELRELLSVCDELGRDALVEVHDEDELRNAIDAGAPIIGVNNRDLRTFEVTLETAERLGPKCPPGAIRVSESGIRSREEIERLERAGFSVFLIGESLMKSADRPGMIRELRGVTMRARS